MDIQKFLFKVAVIIIQTLKFTLFLTPVVLAFRAMKQGNQFEMMPDLQASVFIAFGLGMALTVWNALEFENFSLINPKFYLKNIQKETLELAQNAPGEQILKQSAEMLSAKQGWQLKHSAENEVKFQVNSARGFKDMVSLTLNNQTITLESRPLQWFIPIDLGRNYKNILAVMRVIKETKV